MLRKEVLCKWPIQYLQDELHGILTGNFVVIAAHTGCHAKDTEIIMANGELKKVQNIKLGDKLCGPDGTTRTVLRLVSGEDKFYCITPIKGHPFYVNSKHILHLYNSKTHNFEEYSVQDYLQLSKYKKHLLKLCRCPGIKKFNQKNNIPLLDPYFLGVLLGDGSLLKTPDVCTPDQEIIEELQKQANKYNLRLTKHTKTNNIASSFRFYGKKNHKNPISEILKQMNLYGTICQNKFVPNQYKYGSWNTRREILAGLLDTDGYYHQGTYEIITKGEKLAQDILFIARSLGLAAYINQKKVKDYGFYNRITISGHCEILPLKVERKKPTPRKQIKNVLYTGFCVQETEPQKYYGFTLDGDHLYLTSDFTIHHNCGKSTLSRLLTNSAIFQGCPVVLYSLEDEPQAYVSDFVYREYIKNTGDIIDFAEFLIDDTLHPEKYIEHKRRCLNYSKRTTESGLPLLTIHEMETSPAWTLERVLGKMKEEIARGNKLFIIDHLDVLVPTERPSDMVNTVRQLWDLVAQEQIALITFSQLATNRNKESLCAGLDDLRGSKSKVQTPTVVISLARHNYGFYCLPDEPKAKPTYMRILKNRLGGNTSAAICYFDKGHYIDFYQKADSNESGTMIDGYTANELIKLQKARQ